MVDTANVYVTILEPQGFDIRNSGLRSYRFAGLLNINFGGLNSSTLGITPGSVMDSSGAITITRLKTLVVTWWLLGIVGSLPFDNSKRRVTKFFMPPY